MARNNNAFSLGPMLEKEMIAANRGNYVDWFRNLGLSSKFLKSTMFSKQLFQQLP